MAKTKSNISNTTNRDNTTITSSTILYKTKVNTQQRTKKSHIKESQIFRAIKIMD